jgi:hypothetical protein
MHDKATIQQFIQLRAQGKSFAKIAAELNVAKNTLIPWSRAHQFEIQNLRTIEAEALQEEAFASSKDRWQHLGLQLRRIEEELAKRNLDDVSTARLITLAATLRAEASREEAKLHFIEDMEKVPGGKFAEPGTVLEWKV